ncbi:MAG: hypothetical protein KDK28_10945 [Maritimibacter sp.]|nr:hypothetical protein [Maritimibacter sp.]
MVAIILGMVLGGISEVKPRAAMAAGRTLRDLVDRPKAAIIFDLILLILVLRVRTLIRGPKAKRDPGPGGPTTNIRARKGGVC